ncbi:hypothetical protein KZ348_08635 [Glaesserella parasuis]|nr:hypothetical protein [Glaesserella parasuis]
MVFFFSKKENGNPILVCGFVCVKKEIPNMKAGGGKVKVKAQKREKIHPRHKAKAVINAIIQTHSAI